MIVVETDLKCCEISPVFLGHAGNQLFRFDPFLACTQHDWCAVSVVSTDIDTLVAAHLLEAYPNVGLYVFHQMTDMDRAIGVGEGAGDENFSRFVVHIVCDAGYVLCAGFMARKKDQLSHI